MTAGEERARTAWPRLAWERQVVFGLSAVEAVAVLGVLLPTAALSIGLWLVKRNVPIWDDGVEILTRRVPATLSDLLAPFHQHLDAVPILIWNLTQSPPVLLGLLLASHVALATGTTLFLVRRLGPRPGFAFGLPLGLLGSAHYDLLMPWQILYTIPLLCGLAAVWLAVERRPSLARMLAVAVLLLVAVASSNVGLFLVGAMGLWFLLDRRWRWIGALVPPLALWVLWFATIGVAGKDADGGFAITASALPYAAVGIISGAGGLTGLGKTYGAAILAAGALWLVQRRPRPDPAIVGFGLSLVGMFLALGLFRSGQTVEYSDASRYIYIDGFFLAFGLGASGIRIPEWRWLVPLAGAVAALNLGILQRAWQYYP